MVTQSHAPRTTTTRIQRPRVHESQIQNPHLARLHQQCRYANGFLPRRLRSGIVPPALKDCGRTMLFNFQLRPVQDVAPWGREGDYRLSWFGLTDGWYWLDCGGHELFRYSDSIIKSWEHEGRQPADPPYVDYQIVRLWEDVLDILPEVLSPIPLNLLQRIEPGVESDLWYRQVFEYVFPEESEASQVIQDKFGVATRWFGQRFLNSGYIKQGPRIWLWSDGKTVFIRWDNTDFVLDGHKLWTAQSGTYSLPVEKFVEE